MGWREEQSISYHLEACRSWQSGKITFHSIPPLLPMWLCFNFLYISTNFKYSGYCFDKNSYLFTHTWAPCYIHTVWAQLTLCKVENFFFELQIPYLLAPSLTKFFKGIQNFYTPKCSKLLQNSLLNINHYTVQIRIFLLRKIFKCSINMNCTSYLRYVGNRME